MSIESHSSNESGYGGSSPVFSRQNSNSTLTFNQETATVSFCTSQPPSHSSPHPSLDSASSRRSHPRDAPSVDSTSQNSMSSSPRIPSNRRELSEQTQQNSLSHRDAEPHHSHSGNQREDTSYAGPGSRKETSDHSDSYPSHRNSPSQRYGHTDKTYSSYQWRNGDNSGQKRPAYSRDEHVEPEPEEESELDGHQVRLSVAACVCSIKVNLDVWSCD